MPDATLGQGEGAPTAWHRCWPDFQRLGILHHRLPEPGIQGRREKGLRGDGSQNRGDARDAGARTQTNDIRMIRLCGQCGSRNDPKRVICQDCGVRLPDPQPDDGKPVAPPVAYQPPPPVHKGEKKEYAALKTVRPRRTLRNLALLVVLCLAGGLGWAVSKAMQPAAGVKPPVAPHASTVAQLEESFAKSAAFGRGKWVGEIGVLNQFLASKAAPRQLVDLGGKTLRFERCYIETREGALDLVMVLGADGRELVCRLGMAPDSTDGGAGLKFTSASIGGLEVPAFAARYFAPLWTPCMESFQRRLGAVSSAKGIEFTPGAVIVQWSASSR